MSVHIDPRDGVTPVTGRCDIEVVLVLKDLPGPPTAKQLARLQRVAAAVLDAAEPCRPSRISVSVFEVAER